MIVMIVAMLASLCIIVINVRVLLIVLRICGGMKSHSILMVILMARIGIRECIRKLHPLLSGTTTISYNKIKHH
jgi:hypothetical protein